MKPDPDRQALIDQMTERFRKTLDALDEEAILVVAFKVYHAD